MWVFLGQYLPALIIPSFNNLIFNLIFNISFCKLLW